MLVTGGAGFVGRHLTRRLLEDGHEVHCVDALAPLTGGIDPEKGWPIFDPRDFKSFYFYRQDCRDWFKENPKSEFEHAYHLAAMVGGRLMIENNPLVVAQDLAIDASYWDWARQARPVKSVCFSSSAAYPIRLQTRESFLLLKEDMIDFEGDIGMPDMTYGWAKLTSEYLARLAYSKYGMKSVCFRPFSGYGSDQDMAYPFPSICQRVLDNRNQPSIQVWGAGTQMRDFIHIDDCIEGIIRLAPQIEDGSAVNLSTGIFTSFIQLAGIASEIAGFKHQVSGMSDKPEGVFARGGDTTKQLALGFRTKIDLATGVRRAIQYLEARL